MAYRDSASFGKRQEFVAIAEFLKRGLDVCCKIMEKHYRDQ